MAGRIENGYYVIDNPQARGVPGGDVGANQTKIPIPQEGEVFKIGSQSQGGGQSMDSYGVLKNGAVYIFNPGFQQSDRFGYSDKEAARLKTAGFGLGDVGLGDKDSQLRTFNPSDLTQAFGRYQNNYASKSMVQGATYGGGSTAVTQTQQNFDPSKPYEGIAPPPVQQAGGGNVGIAGLTQTGNQGNQPSYSIPFKAGLSEAQKSGISQLATKPYEQWNPTDKANWNYATNGATPPSPVQAQGQTSGGSGNQPPSGTGQTGGGSTPGGFTPTGDPTLDALLTRYQKMFDDMAAQGKVLNPNIELDPATIQKFLDQATGEIEPYYATQTKLVGDTLRANIGDLQKQYTYQKQQAEDAFKQNLAGSREAAAGAGTVFSGGRGRNEQNAATAQQGALDYAGNQLESSINSQIRGAAESLGGRNIGDLGIGTTMPTNVSLEGQGGFSGGRALNLYNPGNMVGSLEYNKAADIKRRQADLEYNQRIKNQNSAPSSGAETRNYSSLVTPQPATPPQQNFFPTTNNETAPGGVPTRYGLLTR